MSAISEEEGGGVTAMTKGVNREKNWQNIKEEEKENS